MKILPETYLWTRKNGSNFGSHPQPDLYSFQLEGVAPHQPFFFSENQAEWSFVWYKKSGQIFLPFCHNALVLQTDRQTELSTLDRVCIPRSAVKMNRCFTIHVARTYAAGGGGGALYFYLKSRLLFSVNVLNI